MRHRYDADVELEGYVSSPVDRGGTLPCVLVVHGWRGESEVDRRKADEFAAMGVVGFAIDMYGRGVRGAENSDNTDLMTPLLADRSLLTGRIVAAVDAARRLPGVDAERIAVVGYCFGGLCALDLARSGTGAVRGVISVHGITRPNGLPPQPIRSRVLVLHGWDDPLAPPGDVVSLCSELSAAGADWELDAYGHARHAFSHIEAKAPERGAVYEPRAAARAWGRIATFLEDVFQA